MMNQLEARVNRTLLCQWLGLPRSVYYYQPQSGNAGAKPSQSTMKLDGSRVDNQQVIVSIRQLLEVEFNALGYEYITHDRTAERLKKEYLINKKKRGRPSSVSADEGKQLVIGHCDQPD